MSTKEMVLELLEKSRGGNLSGQEMAERLGVSRASVWKAVKSLQNDGHNIRAVTNSGYSLIPDSDVLSVQGMLPHLSPDINADKLHVYKTVASTNITAKEMALAGAEHGTAVIADCQTAGRGRYGRSFFSPPGSGLYMSIVLRPPFSLHRDTLTTATAAVAVCRAIKQVTGLEPSIKWVNDVFLSGKKVCGILTEAMTGFESGVTDWLVVGIGVNVTTSDFPGILDQTAGSLRTNDNQCGIRNRLAACILNYMLADVPRDILSEYRSLLNMLGEVVTVLRPDCSFEAVALDIDGEGRLLVRKPDGAIEALYSGEVSIKKTNCQP